MDSCFLSCEEQWLAAFAPGLSGVCEWCGQIFQEYTFYGDAEVPVCPKCEERFMRDMRARAGKDGVTSQALMQS